MTSCLILATWKSNLPIVNALISANANLNIQENFGETALIWGKTVYSWMNLLIFTYCCISCFIILASFHGYPDIVNALISANANLNIQDVYGNTALYYG